VLGGSWVVLSARAVRAGLAVAADAASCDGDGGEAGASVGANEPSEGLQEAAARPSAAQMSGRKILIMGSL
jgi:hypothetical protein